MASPISPPSPDMKTTIHAPGEPSYYTGEAVNTERRVAYDIIFALIVLLFIIILIYASYMCNRIKGSRSPTPPPSTTADSDTDDFHSITLSTGLEDDILSTFPTFVYSDAVKHQYKGDNGTETNAISDESGCPICLVDYEATDIVRLLPECRHVFHMSCIDMWLKVHTTCPVCRSSSSPSQRS